jgi:hypothetical protein
LRRNSQLKHGIEEELEGRIEMIGRQGRRRKQLLDDLKEKRRQWTFKQEALTQPVYRNRFGRGCRPVVKTDCRMNERQYAVHLKGTFLGLTYIENLVKIGPCFNSCNVGTYRHTQRKHYKPASCLI